MVKNWETLQSTYAGDYRIFKTRWDIRRSPRTGDEHTFVIVESTDWINIIPVTPEGQVVLIHQFRHGTDKVTLEIPGGMVDESDIDPGAAARREMCEETGYDSDEIIYIGSVEPNPAFMNNRCHSFLALNALKVAEPQFDGAEDIAVELFPLADVPELIRNGRIAHALVIAAFYHHQNYKP